MNASDIEKILEAQCGWGSLGRLDRWKSAQHQFVQCQSGQRRPPQRQSFL